MSTEAKSPLHDRQACPLPTYQLKGSTFRCECGRGWISDGGWWVLNNPLAGESVADGGMARPFAEPEAGRVVAARLDQVRLHTANGWAQWLVHEPSGREWTLTLTGLRIEEGNHLAPWSQP